MVVFGERDWAKVYAVMLFLIRISTLVLAWKKVLIFAHIICCNNWPNEMGVALLYFN